METHALFEDGTSSRIVYDFFSPDPQDDPVRLFFLDIDNIQVRNSAKNGCVAAYHILSDLNYIESGDHFTPQCQFAEAKTNINAQGSSAGLAFCLGFVQQIYRLRTGNSLGYSVAATGIVSNGTREAKIEGIEEINPKLKTAAEELKKKDKIFYPSANEGEVEPVISKKAADRGIELIPVSTVEEAIRKLHLPDIEDGRILHKVIASIKKHKLWLGLLLASIAAIIGVMNHLIPQPVPTADALLTQVTQDLKEGRYLDVQRQLDEFLKQSPAPDARVNELIHQLGDSLHLEINFHYLSGREKGTISVTSSESRSDIVLTSEDRYRYSVTVSDSCFLYCFQVDSGGKLGLLHESTSSSNPSLLKVGPVYYFPRETDKGYKLDKNPGLETIYFVASRKRDEDLETAYQRLQQAPEEERERLHRALMKKFEDRYRARSAGVKGIYYTTFTFRHALATETDHQDK